MPKLKNLVDEYLESYNRSFDISIGRRKIMERVNIATIVPDDGLKLNRLTKNENILKEAAIDGARKMFQLFNKEANASDILRYT